MIKSDSELKRDIEAELSWDPAVRSNEIGVMVKDGVVTVVGHLETYPDKLALEQALARVHGIKAMALEIDVRLAPGHRRSDTELARSAEDALRQHALVSTEAVRVTVERGWIRLQGEVDWDFQRKSVDMALRHLVGVVGISNEITLRHRVLPSDVEASIREALTRRAVREARHISIEARGSTVWLRGTVHTQQDRDAAQGAAWSAPGVRTVINELLID